MTLDPLHLHVNECENATSKDGRRTLTIVHGIIWRTSERSGHSRQSVGATGPESAGEGAWSIGGRAMPRMLPGASPLYLVRAFMIVFFLKGALQELKLYGDPGHAEVQCDSAFQVSLHCPHSTVTILPKQFTHCIYIYIM